MANSAELGRIAYEAYAANRMWKTWDDRPIPTWAEVGEGVQGGWVAAAQAVQDKISSVPLDEREMTQIAHALNYSKKYAQAGVPGHGQFLLIAKLHKALMGI